MKKLLLTTAIAGSALFAGNAIAQTTVSGQLDLAFKAISSEKSADGISSLRGMAKEWQVNIANKGKLNNGMDYAAGFSLEHDGQQTGSNGLDENVYIDFISGGTIFTIGTDHIQQSERTLATFVGLIAEDLTNSTGGSIPATDIFLSDVGANPVQAYGVGITQNIPNIGALSAWYAPNNTGIPSAGASAFVGNDDSVLTSSDESAYELGFTGGLGVKGLNTHAFYNKADKSDAADSIKDVKGTNIGVSYNTGAVTVGYNYKKTEYTKAAAATVLTGETTQDEFGIAYAVSPNLTVAANYTKADPSGTLVDAKSKSLAVGYNLGAIALSAQAAKLENYNGTSGTDADVLYLRASTKF